MKNNIGLILLFTVLAASSVVIPFAAEGSGQGKFAVTFDTGKRIYSDTLGRDAAAAMIGAAFDQAEYDGDTVDVEIIFIGKRK